TVKIGEFSRGGLTRGDHRASDHDMGCQEKYVPCGIVDEENGALHITFGSSYKTSDFIVDTIEAKWEEMAEQEKAETSLIQIKMDNGRESRGRSSKFLMRWEVLSVLTSMDFYMCDDHVHNMHNNNLEINPTTTS